MTHVQGSFFNGAKPVANFNSLTHGLRNQFKAQSAWDEQWIVKGRDVERKGSDITITNYVPPSNLSKIHFNIIVPDTLYTVCAQHSRY
jgi:hypothetical protein